MLLDEAIRQHGQDTEVDLGPSRAAASPLVAHVTSRLEGQLKFDAARDFGKAEGTPVVALHLVLAAIDVEASRGAGQWDPRIEIDGADPRLAQAAAVAKMEALPVAKPDLLLERHRQNNRESAALGEHFADHRERVTALALQGAPQGATLAVLGAGNGNDLDLDRLCERFAEVHLVDLDGEAVARAQSRQRPDVAAKLRLRAPVDLSGCFDRLPQFRKQHATPVELANLPRTSAERVLQALPEKFDVVLSTCFLSQLMQSAYLALGARHPQLHLVACALALAHVRSLAQMVRPGGRAHIVTDTVTTETYPLEELWDAQPPRALLDHLELSNNVFSGTGPTFLRRIFSTDRLVAPLLQGPVRLQEPWLWRFSPERSYLVYALSFDRSGIVASA